MGQINNIPALIQIMAWCRPGDKPLSEPKVGHLLTHICVTRPQWVKSTLWAWLSIYTVGYIYDMVHYNVVQHITWWWQVLIQTVDISPYDMTRYCTQHNQLEGKTSVRLRTHKIQPYLTLTGKLWVSLMNYLEKIYSDISGAHCIQEIDDIMIPTVTLYLTLKLMDCLLWVFWRKTIVLWRVWTASLPKYTILHTAYDLKINQYMRTTPNGALYAFILAYCHIYTMLCSYHTVSFLLITMTS